MKRRRRKPPRTYAQMTELERDGLAEGLTQALIKTVPQGVDWCLTLVGHLDDGFQANYISNLRGITLIQFLRETSDDLARRVAESN